jgi:hypothetical protein
VRSTEGSRTGDRETRIRDFRRVAESEGLIIVEGLALSETEEETALRLSVGNVGAPATLILVCCFKT